MKKIIIINGPNLNLLGKREVEIYGTKSFEDYFVELKEEFRDQAELSYYQSNSEGFLIDKIHEVGFEYDGIVLNAGAYTHSSIALADALAGVTSPCVEVHISNIHKREAYRQHSYTASRAIGIISGLGLKGYSFAVSFLISRDKSNK